MSRRSKRERFKEMLPIVTPTAVIVGFVPEDWETKDKRRWPYSACCQDPRHWIGQGEVRPLTRDPDPLRTDPWYWHGYRAYRDVHCRVCGAHVNATEYLRPEPAPAPADNSATVQPPAGPLGGASRRRRRPAAPQQQQH